MAIRINQDTFSILILYYRGENYIYAHILYVGGVIDYETNIFKEYIKYK